MNTKNLENLLTEYEQKRRRAEMELEKRKQQIYSKYPKLEEIENSITEKSINKTKAILNNQKNIEEINQEIETLKKEKNDYLKQEKIDENLLRPKYECTICNDTGYVKDKDNLTTMCNCLKQKLLNISYNKSNLSDIQKENFKNFNENIFSDKIDVQKYRIKCSPRQNIIEIKKQCINFIENFDKLEEKNLLFVGNTGLGKTYMSNCIANELLKQGKTVLYQTAPVLLETIIDNKFSKYKDQKADDFYKNLLNVDLLIIDDLGAETSNTLIISELFTLINSRILNLNNKPTKTIISTNLTIEQIFKRYEERIGSRIAGYYKIYQFFGEDLRLKK